MKESGAHRSDRRLPAEWMRFLAVGALNTAVGYGLYALCISLGLGYVAAALLSMVGGILFNYGSTGTLVFTRRRGSLLRFAVCYLVVLAFSISLLGYFDSTGLDPYLAGALVGLPAAALSYMLLKTFVFRGRSLVRE